LKNPSAVLCANLWRGEEHKFEWIEAQIKKKFLHTGVFKHVHLDNLVLYASKQALSTEIFLENAKKIEQVLSLNLDLFLNQVEHSSLNNRNDCSSVNPQNSSDSLSRHHSKGDEPYG
jgi:hypothetical protein